MKLYNPLKNKYLKFSFVNSLIALMLFFLIQKLYFLPGNDSKVFFLGPIIKKSLINDEVLQSKDFLFINTNFDSQIVDNYDNDGFPNGNLSIVDRQKLINLFKKIQIENSHKYIVCDILFEDKSVYDDSLVAILTKIPKIVIPRKLDLNETLEGFRKINAGLVDVFTTSGNYYKYKLFDSKSKVKSVPLKMYEELNNTSINPFYFFSWLNNNLVFNDYVPEHRLNSYNVLENNKFALMNLGDVINVSDNSFKNYIDNRLVVIGNFNIDMKETLYGSTPGPLILLNSYLAIEKQDNKITLLFLISLVAIFFVFSYVVIFPQDRIETAFLKLPIIGGLLVGGTYVAVMSIMSISLYFIFGNNLNLTYLGLFFYIENLYINRDFYLKKIKNRS